MLTPDILSQVGATLRIVLVDLLLSADNAVVIALACRSLRPEDRRTAYIAGTLGAVAMRLVFASAIVFVMQIPFLKLIGGILLVVIAIRLVAAEPHGPADALLEEPGATPPSGETALWSAVAAILIGNFTMSLDNVVAVAALANGSLVLLAFGLAISIPLLVFGSTLLQRLLAGNIVLVYLAGMTLGWVAGSIAVSDPMLAPWAAQQAPALPVTLPAGAAVLVLWQAIILRGRSRGLPAKTRRDIAADTA